MQQHLLRHAILTCYCITTHSLTHTHLHHILVWRILVSPTIDTTQPLHTPDCSQQAYTVRHLYQGAHLIGWYIQGGVKPFLSPSAVGMSYVTTCLPTAFFLPFVASPSCICTSNNIKQGYQERPLTVLVAAASLACFSAYLAAFSLLSRSFSSCLGVLGLSQLQLQVQSTEDGGSGWVSVSS